MASFCQTYRELINKLKPLFDIKDEESKDDRPPISKEKIEEAYAVISEHYASFDIDSIVNIVENLQKYRFPEDEAVRFEAIRKAVDNFDYDQIPEILSGREE